LASDNIRAKTDEFKLSTGEEETLTLIVTVSSYLTTPQTYLNLIILNFLPEMKNQKLKTI
jgi:hypothetical protein